MLRTTNTHTDRRKKGVDDLAAAVPAAEPVHVMSWREGSVVSNVVRVFYRKSPHVVIILRMSTADSSIDTIKMDSDLDGISLCSILDDEGNGLRRGRRQRRATKKFVDIKEYHPKVKSDNVANDKSLKVKYKPEPTDSDASVEGTGKNHDGDADEEEWDEEDGHQRTMK